MAQSEVAPGVVVETPTGVTARVESAPLAAAQRRSQRAGAGAETVQDALVAALAAAKFDIAATVAFDHGPPGRPLTRAPGEAHRVQVRVAPGQSAVVLVEGRGGVFNWSLADGQSARAVRGAPRVLSFDLDAEAGGTGGQRGAARRGWPIDWLVDKVTEPIRAYVLKFVVTGVIDFAVDRIEGDMVGGLVSLAADDPAAWKPGATPLPVLPQTRHANILLMVHGTFSDTSGSFGQLTLSAAGKRFLAKARAKYDAVLGFDHKTLAEDTRVNARAFAKALDSLGAPAGSRVDAVAYSRGGLVYRGLAETILAQERPDLTQRKTVFVACTNAGTNLARPANWAAMIDLYTNAAMAAAQVAALLAGGAALSPLIATTIRTLGRFVQTFSEVAITDLRVPGLAAMEPGGAVVESLNGARDNLERLATYYAVTSNFVAHIDANKAITGELKEALLDGVTNRLFGDANDLVVDTRSMTNFGLRQSRLADDRVYAFGDTEDVYHTIYFGTEVLAERLLDWLDLEEIAPALQGNLEPAAPAGGAPTRGGRPTRGGPPTRSTVGDAARGPQPSMRPESARRPVTEALEFAIPPAEPPASATCFFAAEMDRNPELGRPASLFVTVSRQAILAAVHAAAAVTADAVPVDENQKLVIEVIALRNCAVVGEAVKSLAVPASGEEVLRFAVEGLEAGKAEVLVEVRQAGQPLVSFTLAPVFIDPAADRLRVTQAVSTAPTGGDQPAVLRIYETYDAGGRLTLRFDLDCPAPAISTFDQIQLPMNFRREEYVASVLKEVEDVWTQEAGEYQRVMARLIASAKIRADGLLPPSIRTALWTNRADIKAVQVISEEPLIPWELLYITDPTGQSLDGRGFLSEWGLVRWLHNVPRPSARLRLDPARVRYVAPEYLNAQYKLVGAAAEVAMLQNVFPAAAPLKGDSQVVTAFLEGDAAGCDLMHFACHGQAQQMSILQSSLLMQGYARADGSIGDDLLTMDMVKTTARFAPGEPRPVVFVNACQTGRVGRGLGGATGFADAFLRPTSGRGAGAFIGALWSVGDDLALTFSETFYTELKAGRMLVEAANAARKACQTGKDLTWLAYSVFGNPFARITP